MSKSSCRSGEEAFLAGFRPLAGLAGLAAVVRVGGFEGREGALFDQDQLVTVGETEPVLHLAVLNDDFPPTAE